MAKKIEIAEAMGQMPLIAPENITIATDKADPLYDERVNMPLDEGLVLNVMTYGVKEPVILRKDGDKYKVVDGRQRVRAAVEANKRLKKEGKEPMNVRCVIDRLDDHTAFGVMVSLNEVRKEDDILVKAAKLERFLSMGKSEEDAAIIFGKPKTYILALSKLLECSAKVKAAVGSGRISLSAAAKMSELARDEQDAQLAELLAATPEGKRAPFSKVYNKVQSKQGKKLAAKPSPKKVKLFLMQHKDSLPEFARGVLEWVTCGTTKVADVKQLLSATEWNSKKATAAKKGAEPAKEKKSPDLEKKPIKERVHRASNGITIIDAEEGDDLDELEKAAKDAEKDALEEATSDELDSDVGEDD